jgi:hypothetical protein
VCVDRKRSREEGGSEGGREGERERERECEREGEVLHSQTQSRCVLAWKEEQELGEKKEETALWDTALYIF